MKSWLFNECFTKDCKTFGAKFTGHSVACECRWECPNQTKLYKSWRCINLTSYICRFLHLNVFNYWRLFFKVLSIKSIFLNISCHISLFPILNVKELCFWSKITRILAFSDKEKTPLFTIAFAFPDSTTRNFFLPSTLRLCTILFQIVEVVKWCVNVNRFHEGTWWFPAVVFVV